MWHLQELQRSLPSMAQVTCKLQLLWTAAAVHSPALLANEWGHKGLVEILRDRLLGDNTKDSYYPGQHVAGIFWAFR